MRGPGRSARPATCSPRTRVRIVRPPSAATSSVTPPKSSCRSTRTPEFVARHRIPDLRAIAQVPGDVVQHAHHFGLSAEPAGCRRFERVVALIRIERLKLAAEHGLVVDDDADPSAHVVDDVDGAAPEACPTMNRRSATCRCRGSAPERCGSRLRSDGSRSARRSRAAVARSITGCCAPAGMAPPGQSISRTTTTKGAPRDQRSVSVRHAASFSRARRPAVRARSRRFFSAGSWRNTIDALRQSAMIEGGMTGHECAGVHRLQHRALRADFAPRPTCTWPVTPLCPAIITSSSMVVLPAMPTCAASSTRRPTATPCAMCTRLSIFVPAPMRVSPTAGPIDRRVRADLDVVFDDDVGELRNLQVRPVCLRREAEAVAADDDAVVQDHAMADRDALADRRHAAWRTQSSPMRAPGPITAFG